MAISAISPPPSVVTQSFPDIVETISGAPGTSPRNSGKSPSSATAT
ncbi:hypothetical protein [Sandaracinus amylolyticus]|nr:hypothetical protein [Sandaracinus amylolyticus]